MGMYVQCFVVPQGSYQKAFKDVEVVHACVGYRNHFLASIGDTAEPAFSTRSTFGSVEVFKAYPGSPFVPEYDHLGATIYVMSPATYLRMVAKYMYEANLETIDAFVHGGYEEPNWLYADELSKWLWTLPRSWSNYEIVLTAET